ncbi:hypothetical protein A2U01_0044117, partial [Trifolium medium]|nr:hypothetical protein [Trifolium medium]
HSYNVNISAFNITTESAAAASEGSKYANVVTAISKLSGKGVFKVILVMLVGIGFGITLFMLSSQVSTYLGSLTSFLGSFFKQKP